ncbi:NlpC/P60 family protein [Tissierella creatinini]|nr:NlpC/P60 family protein [Tissierella creatinini]TJX67152.1 NlpC/P60 family protein [Soehngenia saccharolytica]
MKRKTVLLKLLILLIVIASVINYIETFTLSSSIRKEDKDAVLEREKKLNHLVISAYRLIGESYVYGDTGKIGYDCSGLTYSLYLEQLGIEIPRNSKAQSSFGIKVDKSHLMPGDLLFFSTNGGGISHVGIYVGEGNMIHASLGKEKVSIDSIDEQYYSQTYVTARRIIY